MGDAFSLPLSSLDNNNSPKRRWLVVAVIYRDHHQPPTLRQQLTQQIYRTTQLNTTHRRDIQPMRPKAELAFDSEAIRARGIIVLVKSNPQLVKRKEIKKFSQLKLDFNPVLPPKSPRFSLLVGHNIQPSSSSTNQIAALIIDHQLDFTKQKYSLQLEFLPHCAINARGALSRRDKFINFGASLGIILNRYIITAILGTTKPLRAYARFPYYSLVFLVRSGPHMYCNLTMN